MGYRFIDLWAIHLVHKSGYHKVRSRQANGGGQLGAIEVQKSLQC